MGQRIFNIFSALSFDWAGHGSESCTVLGKRFTPTTALFRSDRSWFSTVLTKDEIQENLADVPRWQMGRPGLNGTAGIWFQNLVEVMNRVHFTGASPQLNLPS